MIQAIIFDRTGVLISHDDGTRNAPLLQLIQRLKKTYKIAVLSNSDKDGLRRYFSDEELDNLFDVAITSGEVGMLKPDPDIFLHVSDRLGVDPSECIFVDDNEGHCVSARSVGMRAIWYQNFDQAKAELEQLLDNPKR